MLNTPDILGWVANVFFLYGVYALGCKKSIGFYSNSLGNVLYAVQAVMLLNSALFWLSIGLTILNIKGIIQWRK